jgi:hypothetical protein
LEAVRPRETGVERAVVLRRERRRAMRKAILVEVVIYSVHVFRVTTNVDFSCLWCCGAQSLFVAPVYSQINSKLGLQTAPSIWIDVNDNMMTSDRPSVIWSNRLGIPPPPNSRILPCASPFTPFLRHLQQNRKLNSIKHMLMVNSSYSQLLIYIIQARQQPAPSPPFHP